MTKFRFSIAGLVVIAMITIFIGGSVIETNMAGYQQVKQAAVSGDLTCKLEPGMYGQFFGTISTYMEADTFYYTADSETGEGRDQSLPTRFNDGAKSRVSGSLRVILPRTCPELLTLHRKFHSMNGVMDKLVLPATRKALFHTGPHMSATESYAERRAEFATLAEDQLRNGVFRTRKISSTRKHPITGEPEDVFILENIECDDLTDIHCIEGYLRDPAAFAQFGVEITNFVIDQINYCPEKTSTDDGVVCPVLEQIETQRRARMNVITQQAKAKEAEARAVKATAEGIAKVAETRADEEVAKTEKIVRAEATREEARLKSEAAAYTKKEQILLGEGEAARKRLVMQADGALEKKLEAYVEVMTTAMQELPKYRGAWTPSTVYISGGGNAESSPNVAMDFLSILSAKALRDLNIDMSIEGDKSN